MATDRFAPRRWFLYSAAGLFVLLCLGIILAGLILMRQGMLLRRGTVFGSSMEPHFVGPRILWRCPNCNAARSLAKDTIKLDRPTSCRACDHVSFESVFGMDQEDKEPKPVDIVPGETIRYAGLRAIRSERFAQLKSGAIGEHGLKRGDVVIVQAAPGSTKELKRLIGLPHESISIFDGEIMIDGALYSKSLDEALRQAILVHSSNPAAEPSNRVSLDLKIDNQLECNAHDSHRILIARDVGVALQTNSKDVSWNASVTIHTAARSDTNYHVCISITKSASKLTLESHFDSIVIDLDHQNSSSPWLVFYLVDGHLLIGDEKTEWVRIPVVATSVQSANGTDVAKIELECDLEASPFEKLLVFRDIEWRGVLDSETQVWEAEPGIVLLGDNVSSSSDSRDRWVDRPGIETVKGMVVETRNPIEGLLRQARVARP